MYELFTRNGNDQWMSFMLAALVKALYLVMGIISSKMGCVHKIRTGEGGWTSSFTVYRCQSGS